MHMYSSLWSLLLPVTVHGRVSDIWRGYFAQVRATHCTTLCSLSELIVVPCGYVFPNAWQRLGEDIGMRLAFIPPVVVQIRNSHNYLADFDSEGGVTWALMLWFGMYVCIDLSILPTVHLLTWLIFGEEGRDTGRVTNFKIRRGTEGSTDPVDS